MGPQIEVMLCDRSGEYSCATGSAHAFSSKSGRCQVGLDLMDDHPMDERSKLTA